MFETYEKTPAQIEEERIIEESMGMGDENYDQAQLYGETKASEEKNIETGGSVNPLAKELEARDDFEKITEEDIENIVSKFKK